MLSRIFHLLFGKRRDKTPPAVPRPTLGGAPSDVPRSIRDLRPAKPAERIEGRAIVSESTEDGPPKYSRIGIFYEDAAGEPSQRVIVVSKLIQADADDEHSMIVAYCEMRGALRHFRVDRISGFFDPESGELLNAATLVTDGSAFSERHTVPPSRPCQVTTLQDLETLYRDALERQGWIVAMEADAGSERLACYRLAKRGNRRLKHPSLVISYDQYAIEVFAAPDGSVVQRRGQPRSRPWGVREANGSLGTWGSIEKAYPVFLNAAGVATEEKALNP